MNRHEICQKSKCKHFRHNFVGNDQLKICVYENEHHFICTQIISEDHFKPPHCCPCKLELLMVES